MTPKTVKPIQPPSREAVYAAATIMRQMPTWVQGLKPLLDAAAREVGKTPEIAVDLPDALDNFGRYCRLLGQEIKEAQDKVSQAAIASAPAPGPTRQVGPRREGRAAASSPQASGEPRKPVRRR